jgi:hypothetical protein
MINYETWCKIHDCHDRQRLNITQIANALGLHRETVARWLAIKQYRPRQSVQRSSLLDPHKDQIVRWLESHPSPQQILQRLQEQGFRRLFDRRHDGGPTGAAEGSCACRALLMHRSTGAKLARSAGETRRPDFVIAATPA